MPSWLDLYVSTDPKGLIEAEEKRIESLPENEQRDAERTLDSNISQTRSLKIQKIIRG